MADHHLLDPSSITADHGASDHSAVGKGILPGGCIYPNPHVPSHLHDVWTNLQHKLTVGVSAPQVSQPVDIHHHLAVDPSVSHTDDPFMNHFKDSMTIK